MSKLSNRQMAGKKYDHFNTFFIVTSAVLNKLVRLCYKICYKLP